MSSNGGSAQPGSPRRGRLGLFASHPAPTAPSEEDSGGLTRDRALILLAHLTLSVGHIFAVHQSSSGDADAKGCASGGRGYKYSPATVVFLVRGLRPSPRSPRIPCRPVSSYAKPTNRPFARPPSRPARLTRLTPPRALRRRLSSSSSSSPSRRSRASSSVATRATLRGPRTS